MLFERVSKLVEWDLFLHFFIEFMAISFLIVMALIVTRCIIGDFNEEESVSEAEWLIIDHCNSMKECKECDKFMEDRQCCRYQWYKPWEWRKEEL